MAGRPRAEDRCVRVIHLLELILKGSDTPVEVLIQELLRRNCRRVTHKSIQEDTALLARAGWPVSLGNKRLDDGRTLPAVIFGGAPFTFLWDRSAAAKKLDEAVGVKGHLARAVVDDLGAMPGVRWAVLGSGTTVHAVAKEIFRRHDSVGIEGVSTANVLVLQEYICQKPKITIEITTGTFDWETACLLVPGGAVGEQGQHAQVLITSFSGLTQDGFQTKPFNDVEEKTRQLNPEGTSSNRVLIPLEWRKIGEHDRLVKFPEEIHDRVYVLYTNRPNKPDDERLGILQYWQSKFGDQFQVKCVEQTST